MLILLTALGCASDEADAEALWEEIQGYDGWAQLEAWAGVKASCDGTHGPYVQIWHDDGAATLVEGDVAIAPDGATLVKEAYESDASTLKSVAVMQKRDGYDADNGDWFWAMYGADGSVSQAGSLSGCYGCHASGTDHVLYTSSTPVDDPGECP
ncbi:MAG: cytochrome P460 family protein [Deltaproteobacteria bacterium]|nr:cytochrome P460 family protein [Deltaproteobacteria bacterium]